MSTNVIRFYHIKPASLGQKFRIHCLGCSGLFLLEVRNSIVPFVAVMDVWRHEFLLRLQSCGSLVTAEASMHVDPMTQPQPTIRIERGFPTQVLGRWVIAANCSCCSGSF